MERLLNVMYARWEYARRRGGGSLEYIALSGITAWTYGKGLGSIDVCLASPSVDFLIVWEVLVRDVVRSLVDIFVVCD